MVSFACLHSGALTVAAFVWQLTEGQIAQLLSGAETAAQEEAALRSWLKDPQVMHRSDIISCNAQPVDSSALPDCHVLC
jgi:hypothetical protein